MNNKIQIGSLVKSRFDYSGCEKNSLGLVVGFYNYDSNSMLHKSVHKWAIVKWFKERPHQNFIIIDQWEVSMLILVSE